MHREMERSKERIQHVCKILHLQIHYDISVHVEKQLSDEKSKCDVVGAGYDSHVNRYSYLYLNFTTESQRYKSCVL